MPRLIVSGAIVLVAAVIVLMLIPGARLPALPLEKNMAEAAGKVVAGLLVVALILERALAAFNDLLFGQERADARQRIAAAHIVPVAAARAAALVPALETAEQIDVRRERARLLMGIAAGFVISAAGVRTIAGLVPATHGFTHFQTIVDICLTAGLLAGGSNGLAKLIDVLQESAGQRLNALRSTPPPALDRRG